MEIEVIRDFETILKEYRIYLHQYFDFIFTSLKEENDLDLVALFGYPDYETLLKKEVEHTLQEETDLYTNANGIFLVARVDAEFAGMVALKEYSTGTGEVKRLFVRPEFRGQGIASKLFDTLLVATWEKGYERIILETQWFMKSAHKMYVGKGFTDIDWYEGAATPKDLEHISRFMELHRPDNL